MKQEYKSYGETKEFLA